VPPAAYSVVFIIVTPADGVHCLLDSFDELVYTVE